MSILDCRPRQLETLGAQRAGLEDMLKEMKRKDDILPKLMTSTGSYEDLFRKEISKYDRISEDIAHNIEAQEQLLLQIQDAITMVKLQCSDFVMTRNIQCREMTGDVQRQMAGLSFHDNKNAGAYNNYPSVGHQNQRSNSQQQADPRPQAPYYQPPEQPTIPGYGPPPPAYSSPQVPSPYHVPPISVPYPHPQAQWQQSHASHEYGQPAYLG